MGTYAGGSPHWYRYRKGNARKMKKIGLYSRKKTYKDQYSLRLTL